MERFWTQFYDPATAKELPPLKYQSLTDFFDDRLSKFADRDFSINMGQTIRYHQVDTAASNISRWLQAQNFSERATIAMMLPNTQAYLPILMGIVRSGRVMTPINPLHTARELEFQLNDAQSEVIFILENFAHTLAKVIAKTPIKQVVIVRLGDLLGLKGQIVNVAAKYLKKLVPAYQIDAKYSCIGLNKVLQAGKSLNYHKPNQSLDDVAFIQYTGGTTGRAKGMLLTHRNILTGIEQYYQWFLPKLTYDPDTTQLHGILALPLYHVYAFVIAMQNVNLGMLITLVTNPRDIDEFVKILASRPFHWLPAVNTLYQALLNHPKFDTIDTSALMLSIQGGMAATPTTAQAWFERTGSPMIEGWGMSENVGAGTCNPLNNTSFSGDIGLPLPGIDIKICDDEGNEVPLGEAGEIWMKGDNVTIGYHNLNREDFFSADGYLKTGDVGAMFENGHIKLLDRKKDMLVVSGFNVYPTEIEAVLLTHPKVLECAVIGVDDEMQGQSVKAFIVKGDQSLTVEELKAFSQEQLTGYKRPRHYQFIDQLPKTAVGKLQKTELRKMSQPT